jgi:hypothetical protein
MKNLIFIFIAILFLSCEKNNDSLSNWNLIGQWNWVKSSGGIAGMTYTPNSTGKNRVLEFSATTLKIYENGLLTAETSYSIQIKKSTNNLSESILVYAKPFMISQAFVLESNKLYLNDYECNDCFASEYSRK